MADENSITVKFATVLSKHTGNQKVFQRLLKGNKDLASVLDDLDGEFSGVKAIIVDDCVVVDSINVYVNGDNVRYLQGLETPLKRGDIVNIIPAAAAG